MRCTSSWVWGPVGLGSEHRITRAGCHAVLAMVPTMPAGTRLLDLIPLLEADHRVQIVFTIPGGDNIWHGTDEFVRRCGGVVLPWQQALQHSWDLVLSASHRHIEQVHGKILLVPHGAGSLKSRRRSLKAGTPIRDTTGLDRELLTYRGRLIPATVTVSNEHELNALRRLCPEATDAAIVAGDLCLDRMVVSQPLRQQYRLALDVGDDHDLIVISSTWSPSSTFGHCPGLYLRLLDEVGASRITVAAVLHPNIWAVHGAQQVRAWLAPAMRRGLAVIPPDEGWQATMIASDAVIGDHGSTTCYAAALGRPVHLATFPDHAIRPGSVADVLARHALRLDHRQPLLPQLRTASNQRQCRAVGAAITDRPGQAAQILRTAMYRLLGLPEPPWPPLVPALPTPQPLAQ